MDKYMDICVCRLLLCFIATQHARVLGELWFAELTVGAKGITRTVDTYTSTYNQSSTRTHTHTYTIILIKYVGVCVIMWVLDR